MTAIDVAYSEAYLDWRLGPDHPTNPERARLAVELLQRRLPAEGLELRLHEPCATSAELLGRVHDPRYVAQTLAGENGEWSGVRPDLGVTAAVMCGGTELLARRILAGETRVGFNPQGAKHHAHRDHGSGFCVFNDMALAASHFMDAGLRVAYIDIDAHHGDGVEALLREAPSALTASIHGSPLFPGTGLVSEGEAINWPLPADVTDGPWLAAVREAVSEIAAWRPQVLLAAIGADAHVTDPLTSMQITEDAYLEAGREIGELAGELGIPILIGGAGGYQPLSMTPRIWAGVVTEIALQIDLDEPAEHATWAV